MRHPTYIVRCPDGGVRHREDFTDLGEAARWAEWGHCCLASTEHEIVPAQQAYTVPGTVMVVFDARHGTTETTFTPFGGAAGHFGPPALPYEDADENLDLEDVDGPFWRGVQAELEASCGLIRWTE